MVLLEFHVSMNCKTPVKHQLMNLARNNHIIIDRLSDRKLHTGRGAQTDSLHNTPSLLGPSQEPAAHLHKPRGAQRQVGAQMKDPLEGMPCPGPAP